jgi:hypothetical protein
MEAGDLGRPSIRYGRGRAVRGVLAGTVIGICAVGVASTPASAATVATFATGVLTVVGDGADNTIVTTSSTVPSSPQTRRRSRLTVARATTC